jgi:hypothetical protein
MPQFAQDTGAKRGNHKKNNNQWKGGCINGIRTNAKTKDAKD